MAHLLRGKQVGIQNDLSAGLAPDFFAVDDVGYHHLDTIDLKTDHISYLDLV